MKSKRRLSEKSVPEPADNEETKAELVIKEEPEAKRPKRSRKTSHPAKNHLVADSDSPHNLSINGEAESNPSSPVESAVKDEERRHSPEVESAAVATVAVDMKVQTYHHSFELELSLLEPLQNLIRLVQPSINHDLSKAGIYLCGLQELKPHQFLKSCVREGSEGTVKVKLSVTFLPDERPKINIEDVLQESAQQKVIPPRALSSAHSSPKPSPSLPSVPSDHEDDPPYWSKPKAVSSGKRKTSAKKRSLPAAKKTKNDQNLEWVPSQSFEDLRENAGMPSNPAMWSSVDVTSWLSWVTKKFDLPELNVRLFSELNGPGLSALSRDMFKELVGKDDRDLFWSHLELLRSSQRAVVPVNLSTPSPKSATRVKSSKSPRKTMTHLFSTENSGSIQLWQFLLELLASGEHETLLEWVGEEGEFRLLVPEKVAEMWGQCKKKGGMNYEKMSRALRYYYEGNILAKVPGKHFTYKYVCDLKETVGYSLEDLKAMDGNSMALNLSSQASNSNPSSPSLSASGRSDSDISADVPAFHGRRKSAGSAALDLRNFQGHSVAAPLSQIAA